jgi:hypothetical protein
MVASMAGAVSRIVLVLDDDRECDPSAFGLRRPPDVIILGPSWHQHDLLHLRDVASAAVGPDRWTAIALDDFCAAPAATLASMGGHPIFPVESAWDVLYKHRLRAIWNTLCDHRYVEGCVATSFGCLLVDPEDTNCRFRVFAGVGPEKLRYPMVVKPDCLDGSEGVIRVEAAEDLQLAIRQCRDRIRELVPVGAALGFDIPYLVQVEEEICVDTCSEGHGEFSAQMLTVGGSHSLAGIADKFMTARGVYELGHVAPAISFPAAMEDVVERALGVVLDVLRAQNVISTWDIMITATGQLALVEGSLRPSGNHVMALHELTKTTSLFQQLLGVSRQRPRAARLAASIFPQPATTIHQIDHIYVTPTEDVDVVVDPRIYSARDWSGPRAGSDSFIRFIVKAERLEDLLSKGKLACGRVQIAGIDPNGLRRTSSLALADVRLGGSLRSRNE